MSRGGIDRLLLTGYNSESGSGTKKLILILTISDLLPVLIGYFHVPAPELTIALKLPSSLSPYKMRLALAATKLKGKSCPL